VLKLLLNSTLKFRDNIEIASDGSVISNEKVIMVGDAKGPKTLKGDVLF
jgi:hypothetical protein